MITGKFLETTACPGLLYAGDKNLDFFDLAEKCQCKMTAQ